MCGRFVTADQAAIERQFGEVADWWDQPQNFDASPHQQLPIMTAGETALEAPLAHWSLLPTRLARVGDWRYATINLQMEKIGDPNSMAGRRFASGRCLVPMAGFYEWSGLAGRKQSVRVFVHPVDADFWLAAGIWDRYRTDDGEQGLSFGILTGPANDMMGRIHNRGRHARRMPVLIPADAVEQWLSGSRQEATALLRPIRDEAMAAHLVARNLGNDPKQVLPIGEVPWDRLAGEQD